MRLYLFILLKKKESFYIFSVSNKIKTLNSIISISKEESLIRIFTAFICLSLKEMKKNTILLFLNKKNGKTK